MHDLFSSISHHGYLFLAIVCFAEAIGLLCPPRSHPDAGAVAAYGDLHSTSSSESCSAMIAGIHSLFHRPSQRMALLVCSAALCQSETCILRSANTSTAVASRLCFLPNSFRINTMSPPLAAA